MGGKRLTARKSTVGGEVCLSGKSATESEGRSGNHGVRNVYR